MVRTEIQKQYEIDPQFFTIKKNREKFVNDLIVRFPNENKSSLRSLFSRENPKIAKAFNIEPNDVKSKPRMKVSKALSENIGITPKPVDKPAMPASEQASAPTVQNPRVNPTADGGPAPPSAAYNITDTQLGAFWDATYGLLAAAVGDAPKLTDTERKDLGLLWEPIAGELITDTRAFAVFALIGTVGIFGRKIQEARAVKKAAKAAIKSVKPKITNEPNTPLSLIHISEPTRPY